MSARPGPRVLVTGAGGMLGQSLVDAFADLDPVAATRAELDVTDADAVAHAIRGIDVVVNAAAYTAVDDAESHEDAATALNATAVGTLAAATAREGARFITVSTDYVFDGQGDRPYPEDAAPNPATAYGRTKAAGEALAARENPRTVIVRTAWLYGAGGQSFPRTMLRLAAGRDTIDVVDDQRGQPTSAVDLAQQIRRVVDAGVVGRVLHGTNAGEATWYTFARETFRLAGLDPERIRPTDSASFVRPAPRPAYSVLGHDGWARAGIPSMRDWREALAAAFDRGEFAAEVSPGSTS